MTFQTILVHVDASRHAPARLRLGARLAQRHGAHLVGAAATGIPRAVFPSGYAPKPDTLEANCFGGLGDVARRALAGFEAIAAAAGVAHSTRLLCDAPDDGLALLARFADLVVVGQDDPAEAPAGSVVRIPEYVILNSARPVLVAPRNDAPAPDLDRVLVAWDGSKEASFALSAALPLLQHAAAVTLLTLGAATHAAGAAIDQDEAAGYLLRHGVRADIRVRAAGREAGRTLLAAAEELGCGLLVMGCYGHTRLRELCLGGASRTVLAEAALPVVFAH